MILDYDPEADRVVPCHPRRWFVGRLYHAILRAFIGRNATSFYNLHFSTGEEAHELAAVKDPEWHPSRKQVFAGLASGNHDVIQATVQNKHLHLDDGLIEAIIDAFEAESSHRHGTAFAAMLERDDFVPGTKQLERIVKLFPLRLYTQKAFRKLIESGNADFTKVAIDIIGQTREIEVIHILMKKGFLEKTKENMDAVTLFLRNNTPFLSHEYQLFDETASFVKSIEVHLLRDGRISERRQTAHAL